VKFEVQVKSRFTTPVEVNHTLRMVEDATNKVVFTKDWGTVHFEAAEAYTITQNYLTATDTGRIPHRVELEAISTQTGEVVWTDTALTIIEFGT
jgi:hypothetical protein